MHPIFRAFPEISEFIIKQYLLHGYTRVDIQAFLLIILVEYLLYSSARNMSGASRKRKAQSEILSEEVVNIFEEGKTDNCTD